MRIVLQRVTSASVTVDGEVIGKIGTGFLLLFGVGHEDTEEDCRRLADKISGLRIFSDENDKINLDLESVGGELLYEYFVDYLRSKGKHVETGSFGADMKVELLNDGPFTVILE